MADEETSLDPLNVPEGGWALARETPSVRWNPDANAWDMWFLGYSQSYFEDPAIGQIRSMDAQGTRWGSSSAPIHRPKEGDWDASFLTSPGALRGSDGTWRLYYSGASFAVENGKMRVGVLTSEDGQTWTPRAQPVFEGSQGEWDASILDPHVQSRSAFRSIPSTGGSPPLDVNSKRWHGTLDPWPQEGSHGERQTQTPILRSVPNSWTDRRVLDVEVLVEPDGRLLMVGYAMSVTLAHPFNPDLYPGRIGLWRSR